MSRGRNPLKTPEGVDRYVMHAHQDHRGEASVEGHIFGPARVTQPAVEHLDCECWCGRHIVRIPQRYVAQGKTMQCGTRACQLAAPQGHTEVADRRRGRSKAA